MIISTNKQTISDIMTTSDAVYKIPDFQRYYSWKKENIEILLQDIESHMESKQKLFYGTYIQYTKDQNSKCFYLIDGQQRLTTIYIMAKVAYKMLEAQKDRNITSEFLIDVNKDVPHLSDPSKTEKRWQLQKRDLITLNKSIEYSYNVFKHFDNLEKPTGNEHIIKTTKIFMDYFKNMSTDKINEIMKFISKKYIELVEIHVNSANLKDVFEIFESVNAKKLELNKEDLLKIEMFNNLADPEQSEELGEEWAKLKESIHSKGTIVGFLDMWTNIHIKWNKTALNITNFKAQIKTYINDENIDIIKLIQSMHNDVEYYNILFQNSKELANNDILMKIKDLKLKEWIICFICLNNFFGYIHPQRHIMKSIMLFSINEKASEKKLFEILRLSFSFMFLTNTLYKTLHSKETSTIFNKIDTNTKSLSEYHDSYTHILNNYIKINEKGLVTYKDYQKVGKISSLIINNFFRLEQNVKSDISRITEIIEDSQQTVDHLFSQGKNSKIAIDKDKKIIEILDKDTFSGLEDTPELEIKDNKWFISQHDYNEKVVNRLGNFEIKNLYENSRKGNKIEDNYKQIKHNEDLFNSKLKDSILLKTAK